MRKTIVALPLTGLLLALLFQGSFLQFILLVMIVEFLIGPTLLLLACRGIIGIIQGKAPSAWYRRLTVLTAVVVVSLIISYFTGSAIHDLRLNATRHYVTNLLPALDEAKKRVGKYPTTLPADSRTGIYRQLSFPVGYSSDGDDFRFEYWDPAGMMNGEEFHGSTRTWSSLH
jgi:hypothetical protein